MPKTLTGRRPRLAAVVLAAGGSARLGRPKQLLRRGTEPLLVRALRLARESGCDDVVVVLGAGALRLRGVLRRRGLAVRILHNPGWADGMGGSLDIGIRGLPTGTDGVLVLLTDQAGIERSDLQRLAKRWRRAPQRAAAARYSQRVGVPAVLPRRYFRRASKLSGDTGARDLLRGLDRMVSVAMPRAAFDVDTAADAAALAAGRFTTAPD